MDINTNLNESKDVKKQMEIYEKDLEEATRKVYAIKGNILNLRKLCKHGDLKVSDYGSATCKLCGESFSWYCPTSPTLECDYEQEDESYDEDCCRYCGCPEARK